MDAIDPELLRGSLDLMVLSTLSSGKKYGYLIQSTLWESSREAIELKAGTLYPILHKLEKEGMVKCHWEDDTGRRRKWYELTAAGRKQLKRRTDEWCRYVDCLRSILGSFDQVSPQPA
ncbi:MAG: PadR family transcriptional regulator [Planctomycetaceae bacterium]